MYAKKNNSKLTCSEKIDQNHPEVGIFVEPHQSDIQMQILLQN